MQLTIQPLVIRLHRYIPLPLAWPGPNSRPHCCYAAQFNYTTTTTETLREKQKFGYSKRNPLPSLQDITGMLTGSRSFPSTNELTAAKPLMMRGKSEAAK